MSRNPLAEIEPHLRERWALGANMLLAWSYAPQGLALLAVPHYFLGQFSESMNDVRPKERLAALNGAFLKRLVSGERKLSLPDLEGVALRFQLPLQYVEIDGLESSRWLDTGIDTLIRRYSLAFVESRGVMLFDIVDFSLFTPFEQASQLSSLSYSLNRATDLLDQAGMQIRFARTTTGDGYYVWAQDSCSRGNLALFLLMLLALADNALAQGSAPGRTVPQLRTAYHVGSHYAFNQSDGLNPTMYQYIVGDVTIELARLLGSAQAGQILMGDFTTEVPISIRDEALLVPADTLRFLERGNKLFQELGCLHLGSRQLMALNSYATSELGVSAGRQVRPYRIVDKHGFSRGVYNLRANLQVAGRPPILLGLADSQISKRQTRRRRGLLGEEVTTDLGHG